MKDTGHDMQIGQNIRALLAKFQETTKNHQQMESIADMKVWRRLNIWEY